MFCEKCGGELRQDGNKLICQKCGAEYGLDYSDGYNADYSAGGEKVAPRGFASKKYIIIIVIAAILVLGGIGTGIAIGASNHTSQSALSGFELAEKYLFEQNYEQAIIAFEQLLEIESMNVDAYLGLAEAYLGLGDKDKAIEVLRRGFDLTGDSRIRERLDSLLKLDDNSSTSETFESDESTQIKLSWNEYNGTINYLGFGHFLKKDGNLWRFCDEKGSFVSDKPYRYIENFAGTNDANYSVVQTEEGRVFCIDRNYNEIFELKNPDRYVLSNQDDPLIITWHLKDGQDDGDVDTLRIYSVKGDLLYSWKGNEYLDGSGRSVDINDPAIPSEYKQYRCDTEYHDVLWVDSVESSLNGSSAVNCINSSAYISFFYSIDFDYDHSIEKEAWEKEREEALNKYGIYSGAQTTHGHYYIVSNMSKVFIENGSLKWDNPKTPSGFTLLKDMSGRIVMEGDDYFITRSDTIVTYNLLAKNSSMTFAPNTDFVNEYDVTNTNFDFVHSFINDRVMLCGRYIDNAEEKAQYALFEINWEEGFSLGSRSDEEILNEGHTRLSDYVDYLSYSSDDKNFDRCLVRKDGKWGYMSLETGEVIAMFDDASNFSNGYAIVTNGGKGHFVDAELNAVSEEFPCDSASTIGDGSFKVTVGDEVKRLVIED